MKECKAFELVHSSKTNVTLRVFQLERYEIVISPSSFPSLESCSKFSPGVGIRYIVLNDGWFYSLMSRSFIGISNCGSVHKHNSSCCTCFKAAAHIYKGLAEGCIAHKTEIGFEFPKYEISKLILRH